ncbi:MAG: DUF6262 family protein [Clostridiales bacterium]|jgi:hypothetical protein|nr:DUF6262 family protein [Clostridiales bacterium]
MKKIPEKLTELQEQRRKETAETVVNAIIELQSQGYDIKIKDLIFVTGLSRSVFAKHHIRRILIEYGVIMPREIESSTKVNDKRHDMKEMLDEKNAYIQRLLFINEQLTHEIERLRGEVHLLTHKRIIAENRDSF